MSETVKVIGRDRNGNPVLRVGRSKYMYKGKQPDGRHLFRGRNSGGYSREEGHYIITNETYFPDEEFAEFQRQMDAAQVTREEKRNTQAAARNKATSFKRGFRIYLKTLRKQYTGVFDEPFQKLRLEVFEQNKMRVALTRKNETAPALAFTMRIGDTTKEHAARFTVGILDRGILSAKSFDDFEIVDLDEPENSPALLKYALKNVMIIVSTTHVDGGRITPHLVELVQPK